MSNVKEKNAFQISFICCEEVDEQLEKDIAEFCILAEGDPKHPTENWNAREWPKNPSSLLYCLIKEKRFGRQDGRLYLVRNQGKIIAVSGVYRSDFHRQIFIAGSRTLTLPEYRARPVRERGALHSDFLFPAQLEWALSQGAKMLLMTFNDHNLWLAKLSHRLGSGKATFLGLPVSAAARQFYSGFEFYPKKLLIKFVYQHTLIKKLDPDFSYCFESMEEP